MYIFCIVLILIASVLIILAVLAQSPKSGMAANFGASNQVMGVRQTADFLEKFTWGLAIAIVILSLLATMTMPSANISSSKSGVDWSRLSKAIRICCPRLSRPQSRQRTLHPQTLQNNTSESP